MKNWTKLDAFIFRYWMIMTVATAIIIEHGRQCALAHDVTLGWTAPCKNEDDSRVDDLAGFNLYTQPHTNWTVGQNVLTNVPATTATPLCENEANGPTESECVVDIDESRWFTVTALDYAGNESEFSEPLYVDLEAPVVTLLGTPEAVLQRGTEWIEPGWSVTDDHPVDVPTVGIEGTVDGYVVGVYTLTYHAVDGSLNSSVVTRVVTVLDQQPPAPPTQLYRISFPSNMVIMLEPIE